MHFRILKVIATSGFLTALEYTEFVFGRSFLLGELTALPQTPSLVSGGPYFKGQERKEEGRGRPPIANSWIRPCCIHQASALAV